MDKSSAVPSGAVTNPQQPPHPHATPVPPRNAPGAPPSSSFRPDGPRTSSAANSVANSATSSVSHSPLASREHSPIRDSTRRAASSSRFSATRSRKNSQQDLSPSRQMRPGLSPSASSRSLNSFTTPILHPASQDGNIQSPTPQKPLVPELKDSPRWPVSPRLRSPPPQLSKPSLTPARRNEQDTPAISVQRPTPSPQPSAESSSHNTSESETEEPQLQSGIRTPARAALETVQEVSLPNSPNPVSHAELLAQVEEKLSSTAEQNEQNGHEGRTLQPRPAVPTNESGSDSSAAKMESRRTSSVPAPPLVTRQSSAMSSKQMKSKPEGSTQTMTVETETVSSIPQVTLTTTTKPEGANGTLKTKPSTETIKPKKEKKRPTRKHPSVNSGNASSKADNFEAKIASAVDEANTSDSEETFVYDSNPPDSGDRSTRRFHSRTPSATSMVSQADRQNLRSIYGVMEGPTVVPAHKKGMKFVNTFVSSGNENLTPGEEEGRGTGRIAGGSGRGTARQHHHIGRWGRQPANTHTSLFDNESPFPNAARAKPAGPNSRTSSNPPSPRNHHPSYKRLSHKQSNIQLSNYDVDDTTGADDERTPLMSGARSARSPRNRRGPHTLRQAESQSFNRRPSYLNRFAACLVLTMMVLLVITGAIGFMFATSQPMSNIDIVSISNVVTSEQVLMFDLTVAAHNPNIVVITIDHANLEIFAKSEHAGTDSDWWRIPPEDLDEIQILDDPISDPPRDDDDDSKPNVLLGRITEFDSPLTFEGSLFHKGTSESTGEVQLPYPGNGTAGGSERWERIFQDEFDLIVKGVVKYSLPLSAHVRSATVSGRKTVKPNSANDPSLRPNNTLDALP